MKAIRTKEQAKQLRAALADEEKALPNTNLFGESMAEEKAKMRLWVEQLTAFIDKNEIPPDSGEDDVHYWLTDKGSQLGADYGVK